MKHLNKSVRRELIIDDNLLALSCINSLKEKLGYTFSELHTLYVIYLASPGGYRPNAGDYNGLTLNEIALIRGLDYGRSLCPVINLLVQDGLINKRGRNKCYYTVTNAGDRQVKAFFDVLRSSAASANEIINSLSK